MSVTIVGNHTAGEPPTPGASLSTCPVCDELPPGCTCLRPSVRRRIARELAMASSGQRPAAADDSAPRPDHAEPGEDRDDLPGESGGARDERAA